MKRRWGACLALLLAALLVLGALGSLADELNLGQNGEELPLSGEEASTAGNAASEELVIDLSGGAGENTSQAAAYVVEGAAADSDFPGRIVNDVLEAYTGSDEDVVIPNTVKRIGKGAFKGNQDIVTVTMSQALLSIDAEAFRDCPRLKKATLNKGLEEIGSNAFSGCSKLNAINFPSTLQTIGAGAFDGCSKLTAISFPSALETIGAGAFNGCKGLTEVAVPANVQTLGANAFKNCAGLKSARLNGPAKARPYGEIDSNDDAGYGSNIFSGCKNLESAVVNGAYVPEGMFNGCSKLSSVKLADSVAVIEKNAFKDCAALSSVVMGAGLRTIEAKAFFACTALESVSLNPDLETIGDEAFRGCSALTAVSIPSVNRIGSHAFRECAKLASVKLAEGISIIDSYAFCSDAFLSSIVIPKSVGNLGRAAFYDCARLVNITVYSRNLKINKNAFKNISASPRFTAYCVSTTATWCEKNGLKLAKAIHKEVIDKAVKPTCTTSGKTEGKHCEVCGEVLVEQKVKKALGHIWVTDKAVEPTYVSTGLTEGRHCEREGCDEVVEQKVRPKLVPESIRLNKTSVTLKVDKKLKLKAYIMPKHSTSKQVPLVWYSDNVTAATVSQDGEVKTVGKGTAYITVMTPNGLKATCKVVVKSEKSEYVPTAIKLNKTSATLQKGKKLKLKVTFTPKDKRSRKVPLIWYSNNVTVATVSNKGVVKAVGAGTATITVMTRNGLEAKCKITVKSPSPYPGYDW